ncbi:MAG TPA: acetamidase/formamidase family protein [Bryobacteraceae bacterium]|nr:acetamidase/formamidase family protein [Bryobacteraceae bacterium]
MKLVVLFAIVTAGFAETHRFDPAQFHNTFSAAHPPVLRIKPGDHVITYTIDARGVDSKGVQRGQGPNPETGPFFIEGAQPGDTLVVHLLRLETNRSTGFSASLLAPYTADPGFLRLEALREPKLATWQIDKQKGIAYLDPVDFKGPRIELPLRPMLGCVATAPPNKAAIPTTFPDNFGGNMDYNGMGAGATLMLPVFEPGALFFLGDGHARQGDGEVLGSAIETSLDVEFSVDLIKGKKINWPRLENDDFIMVLGSSRALNEALQHATTELMRWLMEGYGFDERGASLLLGQGMEYDVSNVVDPEFTIVAKMRKKYLGAVRAASADPNPSMMEADRAFVQAVVRADRAALETLLDADFTWTDFEGKTRTKGETLRDLPQPAIRSESGSETKQYSYGDTGDVQQNADRTHVLRVWVRRADGWKAIVYQEVMSLPAPPSVTPGAGRDCENPCKTVPYQPKNEQEARVAKAYSKLETAAMAHNSAVFATMVADEFVAASSNSNKLYDKRGRMEDFDHSKMSGVAPTPLVSAHMFDLDHAILMTSEHRPDRGKPLHVTRLWIERGGEWVEALSYQTSVAAGAARP